jgi:general secretion pathway protein L
MLLLLLPARPRQHPRQPGIDEADLAKLAAASVAEVFFVWSADGATVDESGRTAPALLRQRGAGALALLPEEALSWQLIRVPKAPAARLPAALLGLVEEQLLVDGEQCHFALAPGARGGSPAWLAITDRFWLAAQLQALQTAGLQIDRVVPLMAPPEPPAGEPTPNGTEPASAAPVHLHIQTGAELTDADLPTGGGSSEDELIVSAAGPTGVSCWPASGSLARRLLPDPLPPGCRITASAAAAAAAEIWLSGPRGHADLRISMHSRAERMLEATASAWNLRQFALAAPNRGGTALRAAWQRWISPAWRPVRWGLAGLALVQLVGLNIWVWQQRNALAERRAAMVQLLRSSHPQVRAVLDAPLQMQRETDTLRAAAGRAGDSDLEVLMQAVASAWPANTPAASLAFETGRLTLTSPELRASMADAIAARLRPAGWQVEAGDGSLAISKARSTR